MFSGFMKQANNNVFRFYKTGKQLNSLFFKFSGIQKESNKCLESRVYAAFSAALRGRKAR
jgi:hypothetical protein